MNLLVNAAHSIDEGDVEHHRIKLRTWTEAGEVLAERNLPAQLAG